MNPFERIEEERKVLNKSLESIEDKQGTFISIEEHQKTMLNFLDLLENDLDTAEYQYEVEAVDSKIETLGDMTVTLRNLEDGFYIFQPVDITGENNFTAIDMKSLIDTIATMREQDKIKKDVLFLAPNIKMLRAKLAHTSIKEKENNEEE